MLKPYNSYQVQPHPGHLIQKHMENNEHFTQQIGQVIFLPLQMYVKASRSETQDNLQARLQYPLPQMYC